MLKMDVFMNGWGLLLQRFAGRTPGSDAAADYYGRLKDRMTNEAFVRAVSSIYDTAEFFPTPIDFLTARAPHEWKHVVWAMDAMVAHASSDEYEEYERRWDSLSITAQDAVRTMGGLSSVRAEYERSPIRAKRAFMDAYREECAVDSWREVGEFGIMIAPTTSVPLLPARVDAPGG